MTCNDIQGIGKTDPTQAFVVSSPIDVRVIEWILYCIWLVVVQPRDILSQIFHLISSHNVTIEFIICLRVWDYQLEHILHVCDISSS